MRLIQTRGGYINADRIIQVDDDGKTLLYLDAQGRPQREELYTSERLLDWMQGHAVSAAPGYYVIGVDEDEEVWKDPVVAWIVTDMCAFPVTLNYNVGMHCSNPEVLCADGTVYSFREEQSFATLEQYRAHVIARRKREEKSNKQ